MSKLFFVNSVDLLLGTGYVIYVVVMLNVFQYIYVLIIHHWYICHHSLSTIIDKISNVDMPFIITLGSSLCHITA